MKVQHFFAFSILASMALCGTAGARSISIDLPDFNLVSTGVSSSASLNAFAGYTLTFAPGTLSSNGASGELMAFPGYTTPLGYAVPSAGAYMYNWGNNPTSQNTGDVAEQVMVYQLTNGQTLPVVGSSSSTFVTSNALEVDFNYYAAGCSAETASLTVNGAAYSAKNPCAAGDNAFFFNTTGGKAVLEGIPSGWTPVPLPASLPLLLSGLIGLIGFGAVRRVAAY